MMQHHPVGVRKSNLESEDITIFAEIIRITQHEDENSVGHVRRDAA